MFLRLSRYLILKLSSMEIWKAFCMVYFYLPQRAYTNIKERNSFINPLQCLFLNNFVQVDLEYVVFIPTLRKHPSYQNEKNHAQRGVPLSPPRYLGSFTTYEIRSKIMRIWTIQAPQLHSPRKRKRRMALEINLSESYARLCHDVQLVRVGHLAALSITIEGRLAVQDTQTPI